ncbi:peroxisomal catalase 1 [Bicyclus anynana]|uniref:Peroxisomal catalase 1 n=1 Tax=Bicyclus anynana TaxID=110368 RepID=A0ABM3LLG4_BICAN|nr:peroxisomal catalase 1 [Bicyclus anynana]
MLAVWIMLASSVAAIKEPYHPAVDQVTLSQCRSKSPNGLMSISSGAPVSITEASTALNQRLLLNNFFLDHMTQQMRERTCTRTVRIKGTVAHGYFEVTHDLSHICRASFLNQIGKRTPVLARFSSGISEKGGSDLKREIRGLALKFYTDEGNFDLLGMNTPMFVINNPVHYVKVMHALRRPPESYLYDPNTFWEMIVKHPESMFAFLMMFADRGIPKTYRHMPGYNIHTMQVVGKDGKTYFVRFHILPTLGIKHMTTAQAQEINFADQDFYTRDLRDSIDKGDFPSWTVKVQIITEEDVLQYGYSFFDITRVIPIKEFPLHPLGKIVLNRNPTNFFAEEDQSAFNPGNLVDGIIGAPDKVFEARRYAYTDAQMYRLGPHAREIPVNCPINVPNSASSDGTDYRSTRQPGLLRIIEEQPYNFDQAREYYEDEIKCGERKRLHETLRLALASTPPSLREKVFHVFSRISQNLVFNVAQGFNTTIAE